MPSESKPQEERFGKALLQLQQLRQFNGPPATFWHGLLEAMAMVSGARLAVLLRQTGEETANWRRVSVWPQNTPPDSAAREFVNDLQAIAGDSRRQDQSVRFYRTAGAVPRTDCAIGVLLETDNAQEAWVAAFLYGSTPESQADVPLGFLRMAKSTPRFYQQHLAGKQSQAVLAHVSGVLDLVTILNAQKHYLAVAMALCNELAARHKSDRVSLGWLEENYVVLQAMSHTEKFERKTEAVKSLEQTMEECLDQDELIVWPPLEADSRVNADHGHYAEQQKTAFICSISLRMGGVPVGVLTCERNTDAFGDEEQRLLSLCGEMAVGRLSELKRHDRWLGGRMALAVKESLGKVVGPEHTWAKLTAILVAVALAVLFFGKMDYRVEAPFILRTDSVAIVSAPFEGYIDEVPVEIGDTVDKGGVILKLDTRDLLLQEASAAADVDRYLREADKARAGNLLAEMRIAQAQADQSKVRLSVVRYRLGQSSLKAPFAGIIVEGDLKKRIGAPLKQGDVLFRLAQLDGMYVECSVKEEDVHELRGDATGEFAFASQPNLRFPLKITRIEPAAQTKEKENIFVVRCGPGAKMETWWRPGMSGVAKLEVGRRTFFWVVSHRTIDFLRMYFWW